MPKEKKENKEIIIKRKCKINISFMEGNLTVVLQINRAKQTKNRAFGFHSTGATQMIFILSTELHRSGQL